MSSLFKRRRLTGRTQIFQAGTRYLIFCFIVLGGIAVGGLRILYAARVKPLLVVQQKVQVDAYPTYKEDFDFLLQNELLTKKVGTADAGPFLNPQLFWVPQLASKSQNSNIGRRSIAVPLDVREAIQRLKGNWIAKYRMLDRFNVDTSLFAGLQNYDYWDIENESPIQELIKNATFVSPMHLPLPDPADILALGKFRLLKGARDRDFLGALKETRKFAELLLTTENLQLVISGLAILNHERKAYRFYVDSLGFDSLAWQPIDANVTRRALRTILATRGYLRLWTDQKIFNAIFLGPKNPPGFCAVANESLPLEFSLRNALEPHLPFEQDWRPQYKLIDQVYQRATQTCRLRYLRSLVSAWHFAQHLPGWLVLNELPYSRKVFGMRLSLAEFGDFNGYSSNPGMNAKDETND